MENQEKSLVTLPDSDLWETIGSIEEENWWENDERQVAADSIRDGMWGCEGSLLGIFSLRQSASGVLVRICFVRMAF